MSPHFGDDAYDVRVGSQAPRRHQERHQQLSLDAFAVQLGSDPVSRVPLGHRHSSPSPRLGNILQPLQVIGACSAT